MSVTKNAEFALSFAAVFLLFYFNEA